MNFNFNKPEDRADWELGSIDAQMASLYKYVLATGTMEHDPERSHERWLTVMDESHKLFNTAVAFPVPLGKRLNYAAAIDEICWMFRGETNVNTLNSKIWKEWASEDGSIGHGYGRMIRALPDTKILQVGAVDGRPDLSPTEYARQQRELIRARNNNYDVRQLENNLFLIDGTIDQLRNALEAIVHSSRSRRVKVQTFMPQYLSMQNLPPCHTDFTFNVTSATDYERTLMARSGRPPQKTTLNLSVQMRSSDLALGRNFNVAQYSAIHHLFSQYAGHNIGQFSLNSVNTHIYEKHIPAIRTYLDQWTEVVEESIEANEAPQYPILLVDPNIAELSITELLNTMNVDMFRLTEYTPAPAIKAEVTV